MNKNFLFNYNFFASSDYKTAVIDGDWGCGKTYFIMHNFCYINNDVNHNVKYISLYGIQNFSSLLNMLNGVLDPDCFDEKNGEIFIPSEPLSTNFDKNVNKWKSVIIFDDIERIAKSISIKSIFGLVSRLCQFEYKIIFILSSDKLSDYDKKFFSEFKEKAVDFYYFFGNARINTIEEIIQDKKIEANDVAPFIDNNLRLLIKAEAFKKSIPEKIIKCITKKDTYFEILCIQTVDCIFNSDSKADTYKVEEFDNIEAYIKSNLILSNNNMFKKVFKKYEEYSQFNSIDNIFSYLDDLIGLLNFYIDHNIDKLENFFKENTPIMSTWIDKEFFLFIRPRQN